MNRLVDPALKHARLQYVSELLRRSQQELPIVQHSLPKAESLWAASSLLTRLLLEATPLRQDLNREEVRRHLNAEGFANVFELLEEKCWIRFVLSRLELPYGIRQYLRHTQISSDELRQADAEHPLEAVRKPLEFLLGMITTDRWWLPEAEASELLDHHRAAHPLTPHLSELEGMNVFKPLKWNGNDGFVLLLSTWSEQLPWPDLLPRVAAQLWEAECANTQAMDDTQRLQRWLSKAIDLGDWHSIMDYLSADSQERLSKSAYQLIMNESDITGSATEACRNAAELGAFKNIDHLPQFPINSSSALDVWKWWEEMERYDYRSEYSARKHLNNLIDLALQPAGHQWLLFNPADWIATCDRPYLIERIGARFRGPFRALLASLLTEPRMASFGLSLITELRVAENPFESLIDWENRAKRQDDWHTALWEHATALQCQGLVDATAARSADAAESLYESLLLVSTATFAAWRSDQHDPQRLRAQFRWSTFCATCEAAGLPGSLTPAVRARLADATAIATETRPSTESMPLARLKALFWLFGRAEDHDEKLELARSLSMLYKAEITRDSSVSSQPVQWRTSLPELQAFPWGEIAAVLAKVNEEKLLLVPNDFILNLKMVTRRIDSLDDDYEQIRTWLYRIQCHLGLLINIHHSLSDEQLNLKQLAVRKIQDIIGSCVESDIGERRPGLFATELFNRYDQSGDLAYFAREVAEGLNHFTPQECLATFNLWVTRETDPVALLTIAEIARPEQIRTAALSRLNEAMVVQFLKQRMWLPEIDQLFDLALRTGNEKIVEWGVGFMEGLPLSKAQRERWAGQRARINLWQAYQRNDISTLNMVRQPLSEASKHGTESFNRNFEDTRSFYRALAELDRDPTSARDTFRYLLSQDPSSESCAVNAFAAELKIADRIQDTSEKVSAFASALEFWNTMQAALSPAKLHRVRDAATYLHLAALDGAREDSRFDREFSSLDAHQKTRIAILGIVINNSVRRNRQEWARKFLNLAKPYHVEAGGSTSEEFQELETALKLQNYVHHTHKLPEELGERIDLMKTWVHTIEASDMMEYVRVMARPATNKVDRYIANHLLEASRQMLKRAHLFRTKNFKEDHYSDILWSLISMRLPIPWALQDQSRGGSSDSGVEIGERDGVIYYLNSEVALIEALKLTSVDKSNIDKHIGKAMIKYNPLGVQCIYIIVYYEGASWSEFCKKYYDHVIQHGTSGYTVDTQNSEVVSNEYINSHNLWHAITPYHESTAVSNISINVHHIMLNLN